MIWKNLQQIVKWPTHDAGRTLDHCWVSTNAGIQLERYSPYYSDHDALVIKFELFPWNK